MCASTIYADIGDPLRVLNSGVRELFELKLLPQVSYGLERLGEQLSAADLRNVEKSFTEFRSSPGKSTSPCENNDALDFGASYGASGQQRPRETPQPRTERRVSAELQKLSFDLKAESPETVRAL